MDTSPVRRKLSRWHWFRVMRAAILQTEALGSALAARLARATASSRSAGSDSTAARTRSTSLSACHNRARSNLSLPGLIPRAERDCCSADSRKSVEPSLQKRASSADATIAARSACAVRGSREVVSDNWKARSRSA